MKTVLIFFNKVFFLFLISCSIAGPEYERSPNIIFIIVDDQNMELSSFNREYIQSPNMDRLASRGIVFTNAYVQQAVCAASRASFLTGLHPESTGVEYPYSYYFIEEVIPKYNTIPGHFFRNGYYTRLFGKIHHGYSETVSETNYSPGGTRYVSPENIRIDKELGSEGVPPYEMYDGPDSLFRDCRTADAVVRAIAGAAEKHQPFFFAVGFSKPHLPFSAPKKYWDLYERESIPLAQNNYRPEGYPDIAISRYNLNQYKWEHDIADSVFSEDYQRLLRHAYFACTSFVDAQIGKILDQIRESGIEEDTYIVYISDHGFHLGEQIHWGKTTLYESSLRSPVIIAGEKPINQNKRCNALVEYVDIMPTLMELAGVEVPDHAEGISLVPLLQDPGRSFKNAVFSRQEKDAIGRRKGYSVRNDRYRYTEYHDHVNNRIMARELYDLDSDPLETYNMAIDSENENLVNELSQLLQNGWKKALPEWVTKFPDNPEAPPAYSWGAEGIPRREIWHEIYGGSEEEGWRKATERRLEKGGDFKW
ncbi:MAG: sulfatase [Cyclobacteriaceae bacterium]|nr:sulfatase [Cyclobacteriaceae bacterium]